MSEKKPIDWRNYFTGDFFADEEATFVFGRGTDAAGPQIVCEVRGWGYLNGARCGLPMDDAIEVQRQILEVITAALKAAWKKGNNEA